MLINNAVFLSVDDSIKLTIYAPYASLAVGGTLILVCVPEKYERGETYQWWRDGRIVSARHHYYKLPVTEADAGIYTCRLRRCSSYAEASVRVDVSSSQAAQGLSDVNGDVNSDVSSSQAAQGLNDEISDGNSDGSSNGNSDVKGDVNSDEKGDVNSDEKGDVNSDEKGDVNSDEKGDGNSDEKGDVNRDEKGDVNSDEKGDVNSLEAAQELSDGSNAVSSDVNGDVISDGLGAGASVRATQTEHSSNVSSIAGVLVVAFGVACVVALGAFVRIRTTRRSETSDGETVRSLCHRP
jgi:hypothetical protein